MGIKLFGCYRRSGEWGMVYDRSSNSINFRGSTKQGWTLWAGMVPEGVKPCDSEEVPAEVKLAMDAVKLVADPDYL